MWPIFLGVRSRRVSNAVSLLLAYSSSKAHSRRVPNAVSLLLFPIRFDRVSNAVSLLFRLEMNFQCCAYAKVEAMNNPACIDMFVLGNSLNFHSS